MRKILIIQTAFIGDVVLATSLIEKLSRFYPEAKIDFLLRKGNEGLLDHHPTLNRVLIWDKKNGKWRNLFRLIHAIRLEKYDLAVNLHRFFSTGFLTVFSGAKTTCGFSKNPLSFLFDIRIKHKIGEEHEVARNQNLISKWTDNQVVKPKLFPAENDFSFVFQEKKYCCIAPATVWFTKQYPLEKWVEFMDRVGEEYRVILIGGKTDFPLCEQIARNTRHTDVLNFAGKLSYLQSAALMSEAVMNFTNDSAPLHIASAMNAPVTAIFCSTAPAFGFTPLSEISYILESPEPLDCRPCGLHGKRACPEGHFKCSHIPVEMLLSKLP